MIGWRKDNETGPGIILFWPGYRYDEKSGSLFLYDAPCLYFPAATSTRYEEAILVILFPDMMNHTVSWHPGVCSSKEAMAIIDRTPFGNNMATAFPTAHRRRWISAILFFFNLTLLNTFFGLIKNSGFQDAFSFLILVSGVRNRQLWVLLAFCISWTNEIFHTNCEAYYSQIKCGCWRKKNPHVPDILMIFK